MTQYLQSDTSLKRSASAAITSSFTSIPRDKKASWGNRFLRDQYDLLYEANPEDISNRLKRSSKNKWTPQRKSQGEASPQQKYQYTPFKGRGQLTNNQSTNQLNSGLNPQEYLNCMKIFESKLRSGVQTAPTTDRKGRSGKSFRKSKNRDINSPQLIGEEDEFIEGEGQQKINRYGLSRFQYNQTLKGKLEVRSNHHIDFEKSKTEKINNMNAVWYNESEDLSDVKLRQPQYSAKKLESIHSFRSDSSHKLFHRAKHQMEDGGAGKGGMLDKYYDTITPHCKIHERGLNQDVNYSEMTGKPPLIKKLGTNLDYKTTSDLKTLGMGNGKRPMMEIVQSKKELVYKRQVIDPKRACFR